MKIANEQEYKEYEARMERLIQRGTELGDMELLSNEEKEEFTMLSDALDEYGKAYHPLPDEHTAGRCHSCQSERKRTETKGGCPDDWHQPDHFQRLDSPSPFIKL